MKVIKVVDAILYLGQVLLELGGREHVLELTKLLIGDLALPLDVALALGDH